MYRVTIFSWSTSFLTGNVIAQRKLRWVKSGVNRWVWVQAVDIFYQWTALVYFPYSCFLSVLSNLQVISGTIAKRDEQACKFALFCLQEKCAMLANHIPHSANTIDATSRRTASPIFPERAHYLPCSEWSERKRKNIQCKMKTYPAPKSQANTHYF